MSDQILTTSDLIFPDSSGNFSRTLTGLKRSRLSVKNRISSILLDSNYVSSIAETYNLPLVANERCGSWYIPSSEKAGSVYFKSTDGHQSQWKFSTRRLNLQLLELLGERSGCIIVDSTRRGKLMPDALSKTVPIWCAVMNRFLFPEISDSHTLVIEDRVVSASEASQIEKLLDGFVQDLRSLGLDAQELRRKAKRPVRPYFVALGLAIPESVQAEMSTVVCCSASRKEHGDNDDYIQGAGDDNEHWSRGLTAQMFRDHQALFEGEKTEEQLQAIVDDIVANAPQSIVNSSTITVYEAVASMTRIEICDLTALRLIVSTMSNNEKPYALLLTCDANLDTIGWRQIASKATQLDAFSEKNGSRQLRNELFKIDPDIARMRSERKLRILVACSSGRDLSVAVALAVACRLEQAADDSIRVDKAFIRQKLAAITFKHPLANPSRATLQSVNAYLMSARTPS